MYVRTSARILGAKEKWNVELGAIINQTPGWIISSFQIFT
jgi:hypothetical protein